MGKGILLEVEGRSGVVLTPKGEFKRVSLPHSAFDIGAEIQYKEPAAPRWGWLAAAAAVLLMLVSPVGYNAWTLAQPAALVMIEINPSIQLTIDGRERVIKAEGLNADGLMILEGIEWQKRSVEAVTRAITAKAVAAGKLDPGAESSAIVVAVAPVTAGKASSVETAHVVAARSKIAAQTEVKVQAEAKGKAPKTQVAAVEATVKEVEAAKEQGLTLPKLIILQEVQASRPEVTGEALKEQGPGKFLHGLGISPSAIFSQAEERHNKKETPEPARENKPEESGKKQPATSEEKNQGKGQEKSESNENKEKAKEPKEEKGLLDAIKVKLGIGGSNDGEKGDDSSKGSKAGDKSNKGQEKADPKANEGNKGSGKP